MKSNGSFFKKSSFQEEQVLLNINYQIFTAAVFLAKPMKSNGAFFKKSSFQEEQVLFQKIFVPFHKERILLLASLQTCFHP